MNKEEQNLISDLKPCSDVNCILRLEPAKGMVTNGGCQHLKLDLDETRRLLQKLSIDRKKWFEWGMSNWPEF